MMIFKVGAEMDMIFVDFSRKKSLKIHPWTLMNKKSLILSF